jgi:hypothetical protein
MGGSSTINTSGTRLEALTLQSSAYGVTLSLAYGVCRVAGNLLWYGGFRANTVTQSSGKGGGVETQSYNYTADLVMGLCEGPITGINNIWKGDAFFSGGITGGLVATVTETYTMPTSGSTTYTVAHAAAFRSMVGVRCTTGAGDAQGVDTLALGTDYSVSAGVLVFTAARYRGLSLYVTYQYLTDALPLPALQQLGLTLVPGNIGQAPWSGLASYGAQSIGYSGVACVAATGYGLGTGAQMQNHNFEIVGPMAYHLGSTVPDVDPSLVLRDVLSNARAGAAFPPGRLDDWAQWSAFCVASGLLVSPAMTQQTRASDIVDQACKLTNTAAVWSGGRLRMVPYSDTSATGNGVTYTPNTTPVYALNDDCWVAGTPPLKATAKAPADRYNHVRVQYKDRANQYAPAIAEAKDQADIAQFGLRSAAVFDAPWICDGAVARQVAQLLLQRSLFVVTKYEATLPWHFSLLEPMDLVTLTDTGLGLVAKAARVLDIAENAEGDLKFTFEEYPAGVSSAAIYPHQGGDGYQGDYNASPGDVDTPVVFEAPAARSLSGLELGIAVRGSGANWGGCQVWVSLDGSNYRQVGTAIGGARYGSLSASVGGGASVLNVAGLGSAQLISGSSADAARLSTLCYVGGSNPEYLAYETATLTGAGAYTLGGLVHGAYNTNSGAHTSGDPFVRVDDRIVYSGELDVGYVGQTVYIKCTSFNLVGGGQQGLADVSAHTYTVTGAMAALLPGQAGKGLDLKASALTFQVPLTGSISPASITLTALRKGVLQGTVSWSVVAGTVTLAGSGDTRTIDPATLSTDTATVQASVTDAVATYLAQVTVAKVRDGATGATGASAPLLTLLCTAQAYTYNAAGTANPSTQTVSFTAQLANLSGTATFAAALYDASGSSIGTPTMGGSGNTRTLTVAQFSTAQYAVVSASLSGYSDRVTVVRLRDGSNAVQGVLTNQSVAVAADSAGTVASFASAGGTFEVWNGATDVTGSGPTYSVVSSSSVTISINSTTGVYTVSAMAADLGSAVLRAAYGGVNIDRPYSISKSKAGTPGVTVLLAGSISSSVTYSTTG